MQDLQRDAWLSIVALAIMVGVAAATFAGIPRLAAPVSDQLTIQPSAGELGEYVPRFHYPEKYCLPAPTASGTPAPIASGTPASSPDPSATCGLPEDGADH